MKRSELFFSFLKVPVDLVMIVLAFMVAYWLRTYLDFVPVIYVEPFANYMRFVLTTLPIWLVVFIFAGVYSLKQSSGRLESFGKILVAVSASAAILMAWIFLSRTFFFSRLIIIYAWFIAVIFVMIGRWAIALVERSLYRWGIGVHRVMVVAGNSSSEYLISTIKSRPSLGYKLAKVIDESGIDRLERIYERAPVDEIVIADPHITQQRLANVLQFCRDKQIGFKMTPDLFLVESSHLDIRTLAGVPIIEFKRTPLDGWGRIIKRIADLVGAALFVLILSPVLIIVALIVKLTSRGPVFYRQERVGFENRTFKLMKFRSMKIEYCRGDEYGGEGAEKAWEKVSKKNELEGPVFKLKNDPRVTFIGKIIRKTSIDELPQFFNVLKGEMSLIGPRPPLPEEVAQYSQSQRRRLGIKPGITGLWQVSGRNQISFDEWVRLDAYYIENWSLWLDIQIFLKTIWVVVTRRGAY